MRCPSCGAVIKKRSMRCPECGAFRNKSWVDVKEAPTAAPVIEVTTAASSTILRKEVARSSPSLIEFPGLNKTSLPQWRKELGERVREVQERKAREASAETELTEASGNDELKPAPVLELLPQADLEPMNPIVVAALQRIERAHSHAQFVGNNAMAPAYDERPELNLELARVVSEDENKVNETPQPERVHNLAVVPPIEPKPAEHSTRAKPKRLIRDDNDPALNYLDTIPTTVGVDIRQHRSAPVLSRIGSAFIDLIIVCLLSSPALLLARIGNLEWQELRAIAFAAGVFVVISFLYLTSITALTGRTVGMRLFSLRVVDARTGLIPTGTQAAGRAVVYILSLASAGIALMYMFIDREQRTAHDRCTGTTVVRV